MPFTVAAFIHTERSRRRFQDEDELKHMYQASSGSGGDRRSVASGVANDDARHWDVPEGRETPSHTAA